MSHHAHAHAAARPPPLIELVTSVPVRPSPMQPASSRGPLREATGMVGMRTHDGALR